MSQVGFQFSGARQFELSGRRCGGGKRERRAALMKLMQERMTGGSFELNQLCLTHHRVLFILEPCVAPSLSSLY